MNIKLKLPLLATVLCLSFSQATFAGEKEDALVEKIVAAYGGDKIKTLNGFTLKKTFHAVNIGQSQSVKTPDILLNRFYLSHDLKNGRVVFDNLFQSQNGDFQGNNIVVSDTEAYVIDHQAKTYRKADDSSYYGFSGGTRRTSDTLLVLELIGLEDKTKLKIGADTAYLGRQHTLLTMPFPQSADVTLYIDKQTHLINKMTRHNPQFGDLSYVFKDHKNINGVTHASISNFYIGDTPNLIQADSEISFNPSFSEAAFKLPENYSEEKNETRIDATKLKVNKLATGIYHIGQGGGHSLFVSTNLGTVAIGGYPGIEARFKQFQKESGNYSPLSYQVVSHHHSDHIGGIAEATALGAKLVTVKDEADVIKAASPDASLTFVDTQLTLGQGKSRVEIFKIATPHAENYLVFYVPAKKLIFLADHFNSPFETKIPDASANTVEIYKKLLELNIDIKLIAAAHGPRVFSFSDMKRSVENYQPSICTGDRPVCVE